MDASWTNQYRYLEGIVNAEVKGRRNREKENMKKVGR